MSLAGGLKRAFARIRLDVGRYPPAHSLQRHVSQLLRRHQIKTVIDVGANVGQYGNLLRQCGFDGAILSFEPVSESFRQLASLAARDPRWHVWNLAVGDADVTADINVTRSTTVSSLLLPNKYYRALYEGSAPQKTESVRVCKLDTLTRSDSSFAAQLEQPIWLKVDAQGYDLRVLAGARDLLRGVTALQIELSVIAIYEGMPGYLDVLAHIHDSGFSPTGFFPVSRDRGMRLITVDGIFARTHG